MSEMTFDYLTPTQMLDQGVEKLESLSARMGIYAVASFVAVLVWFLILGFAGMHLIKLYSSVCSCGAGFYLGCVGFLFLKSKVSALGMLPDFLAYVAGMLCMLLFFYLAWRMCEMFVFLLLGAGGALAAYMLIGNWIVAGLIGVALMIAAYYCFVASVIVTTGCMAGVATAILLGLIFPKLTALQSITDPKAILIALGISAVFVLMQWCTTPNYRKCGI